MLFLVVLGGAAVLEVHRALHHGGNGDVKALRERESALRKQLQDIQRELRATQQQRELTEAEAAQLAAVNTRLTAENATLASTTAHLTAENAELAARAESLAEKQASLEAAAEGLRLENTALLGQFDRLKLRHEEEAAGWAEQLAELKATVSGALSRFACGEISADQLVAFLAQMGVELRGRKEDLATLPEQLNSARSTEERIKLLDNVQVEVGEGWLQQMRLITAEPERAARLLAAGQAAARAALSSSSGAALLETPQAAAARRVGPAVAKLPTPPKERPAAQLPAVKVPPLKLKSAAASAAVSVSADENAHSNLALSDAPSAAVAAEVTEKQGGKAKKGGTLRFMPGKKVAKKQAVPPALQLELDVSLGQGTSAVPRLPFDAVHEDMNDLPGSRSIVTL
ncbi:hypothetical protein ABPG77_005190 [Micractinium sp. CCAP 211/92]